MISNAAIYCALVVQDVVVVGIALNLGLQAVAKTPSQFELYSYAYACWNNSVGMHADGAAERTFRLRYRDYPLPGTHESSRFDERRTVDRSRAIRSGSLCGTALIVEKDFERAAGSQFNRTVCLERMAGCAGAIAFGWVSRNGINCDVVVRPPLLRSSRRSIRRARRSSRWRLEGRKEKDRNRCDRVRASLVTSRVKE